jgi:hypothetical protein
MSESAGVQIRHNQLNNFHLDYVNIVKNDYSNIRSVTVQQLKELDKSQFHDIWSEDITEVVYVFHSMFAAYQIIRYMGFSEIYLCGVNLFPNYTNYMRYPSGLNPADYSNSKLEFLKTAIAHENLMKSLWNAIWLKSLNAIVKYNLDHKIRKPIYAKQNYKKYFTEGQVNTELIKSHLIANKMLAADDISVYNATPNSQLDVFPNLKLPTAPTCVQS